MDDKNNLNNEKTSDLKRYETDVAGVSLKKLETGLWWIKNRGRLKKILIAFLAIAAIGGWGYALYGVGHYLFKGMGEDEKMVNILVNTEAGGWSLLSARAAQEISVLSVGVLKNSSGDDLYAVIRNPNKKHWGEFSYCFSRGEEKISCGQDFVLPNEKKYLLVLGIKNVTIASDIKLTIDSTSWHKLATREIPDWEKYRNERLNFEITNTSFLATGENGVNYLSFIIFNNTPYNFWEVPLSIILERGNKVIGVNRYVISEFISLDTRQIKINWPGELAGVGNIIITPDINIMKNEVYMQADK
jgi:hypothetical protein